MADDYRYLMMHIGRAVANPRSEGAVVNPHTEGAAQVPRTAVASIPRLELISVWETGTVLFFFCHRIVLSSDVFRIF